MLTQGYKFHLIDYRYLIEKLDFIEEICLELLNFSLQIPFIPVKKTIFLLGFYLNLIFENDPYKNEENNEIYEENMKFMSENAFNRMIRAKSRISLKMKNKVEKFYEKHIVNVQDSPLAQIITVGTLRALLATCSTNTNVKNNNPNQNQNQNQGFLYKFIKVYL